MRPYLPLGQEAICFVCFHLDLNNFKFLIWVFKRNLFLLVNVVRARDYVYMADRLKLLWLIT